MHVQGQGDGWWPPRAGRGGGHDCLVGAGSPFGVMKMFCNSFEVVGTWEILKGHRLACFQMVIGCYVNFTSVNYYFKTEQQKVSLFKDKHEQL